MFLALVAFVFTGTSLGSAESDELATVSFASPSQSNELLTASGYIVAQQKAAVASKATGRIVFLGHHEGDNVRKGDIIARIESADVEAALAQAQAELALGRADREDAQRSLERPQRTLSRERISHAEVDAATAGSARV